MAKDWICLSSLRELHLDIRDSGFVVSFLWVFEFV